MRGKSEREQLRVVQGYLDSWHDSWKGPYWDLKERLRRLVHKLENTETVKGRGGSQDTFHVARQGVAQIAFAGPGNAGKSALVHALTGAPTVIADYPFATTHPSPGILPCSGGVLQLVDTPPVMAGLARGEGPGRALLHLLSTVDALAIVLDGELDLAPQLDLVLTELTSGDLVAAPGNLGTVLRPRGKGGVKFRGLEIGRDEARAARRLLETAGVEHAEVMVRTAFSEAQLRLQLEHRRVLPSVVVAGKSDVEGAARRVVEGLAEVDDVGPVAVHGVQHRGRIAEQRDQAALGIGGAQGRDGLGQPSTGRVVVREQDAADVVNAHGGEPQGLFRLLDLVDLGDETRHRCRLNLPLNRVVELRRGG